MACWSQNVRVGRGDIALDNCLVGIECNRVDQEADELLPCGEVGPGHDAAVTG